MRYLEEIDLESKWLVFQDFDFTNPKDVNHCEDGYFGLDSCIKMP